MASTAPELASDRRGLERRLHIDLLQQRYDVEWQTGNMERLQGLEARILATARQLEPEAPQVAIVAAQRSLSYNDLANQLVRRAELPYDPMFAAEAERIRTGFLENRILDLARELEPTEPAKAIAHAAPIAHEHLASQFDLVLPDPSVRPLSVAQESLDDVSRLLGRMAAGPETSQHQRVHQTLMALRRHDVLDLQHRQTSEERRHLAFRGNVVEIKAALERIPPARDLLEDSVAEIYRDPDQAIRGMREDTRRRGLEATIDRFDENPAAFGKLRGRRIPVFGDSPERSRALDLVWHDSGYASTALVRRDGMERELEAAVSRQRLQNENRELVKAFPSREKLLTELGRHMEGLEIHEVRPLLQPGQAKLVQDVRRAEQHFLEPLREASRSFRALDAGSAQLGAQAQKIAGLYQGAPSHILRRLTPPQMQAVLVASAMVRRVTKAASKVASV